MTLKLTESKLENLVDTLNAIICGEVNITREQRENMVRTVAILGGLTERQRLITAEKQAKKAGKRRKGKKIHAFRMKYFRDQENRGHRRTWTLFIRLLLIFRMTESTIIYSGCRRNCSAPLMPSPSKFVSEGRMNEEWAKGWKPAAKSIREDFALVREKIFSNNTDNP